MWDTQTHHDNLMLQQNATLDHILRMFVLEALQRKHVFITRVHCTTHRALYARELVIVLNCFQMKAHQRTNK